MSGTGVEYAFELSGEAATVDAIDTFANHFFSAANFTADYFDGDPVLLGDFVRITVRLEGAVPRGAEAAVARQLQNFFSEVDAEIMVAARPKRALVIRVGYVVSDASGFGYATQEAMLHELRASLAGVGAEFRRTFANEVKLVTDGEHTRSEFSQLFDLSGDPFVHVLGALHLVEVYLDAEPLVRRDDTGSRPWAELADADRRRVAASWFLGLCECGTCRYARKSIPRIVPADPSAVLAAARLIADDTSISRLVVPAAAEVLERDHAGWKAKPRGTPALVDARKAFANHGVTLRDSDIVSLGCRWQRASREAWQAALAAVAAKPATRAKAKRSRPR